MEKFKEWLAYILVIPIYFIWIGLIWAEYLFWGKWHKDYVPKFLAPWEIDGSM